MNVEIRPLRPDDIARVAQIERESFPTLWPPTPFQGELNNRMAKYLLACESNTADAHSSEMLAPREAVTHSSPSLFSRLVGVMTGGFHSRNAIPPLDYSILGFVGLLFVSDETHITGIAVEEASRGRGIGELLLMGSIDLSMEHECTMMSLEVRVSNYIAQSLYKKYGFREVNIRKGYYSDNRENAAVMSIDSLDTPAYREEFMKLREAYRQRYGEVRIALS